MNGGIIVGKTTISLASPSSVYHFFPAFWKFPSVSSLQPPTIPHSSRPAFSAGGNWLILSQAFPQLYSRVRSSRIFPVNRFFLMIYSLHLVSIHLPLHRIPCLCFSPSHVSSLPTIYHRMHWVLICQRESRYDISPNSVNLPYLTTCLLLIHASYLHYSSTYVWLAFKKGFLGRKIFLGLLPYLLPMKRSPFVIWLMNASVWSFHSSLSMANTKSQLKNPRRGSFYRSRADWTQNEDLLLSSIGWYRNGGPNREQQPLFRWDVILSCSFTAARRSAHSAWVLRYKY